MQAQPLFAYLDYKKYVNDRLDHAGGRGNRSALAKATRCQSAYVSSVLRGNAHFTPEQGESINEHFGHSESEADYFLLLLQLQRAGSEALKKRLRKQMEKIQESRFDLKKRLGVGAPLSKEDQLTYYSEWHYSAIHTLSSVPGFQTVSAVARHLRLDPSNVAQAVEFLLEVGLLEPAKGGFKIGKSQLHLGSDSPLLSKHHINWRLQAMQKLSSRKADENLHYSSVITLSETDVVEIKEKLVAAVKEIKTIVRDSKEETLQCFSLDFFRV